MFAEMCRSSKDRSHSAHGRHQHLPSNFCSTSWPGCLTTSRGSCSGEIASARLLLCLLICAKARRPRNRADRLLNSVLQQIKSPCSALQ